MTASPQEHVREYVLAARVRARLLGLALLAAGILLCVLVVALAFADPGAIPGAAVVVLLFVVTAGLVLRRRAVVVRLDDAGYRVRFVRGVGTSTARWSDVIGMATAEVAGTNCVVLRLRDGRSTTIPVGVLAGDPEAFVRDLGARLEAASARRRP